MDLDIVAKLMPNIITILVQLAATAVIYLMYKKHLHEPVMKYLNDRKAYVNAELQEAEALKKTAEQLEITSKKEYQEAMERLKQMEEDMIRSAQAQKKEIIASAQDDIDQRILQVEQDLAQEREDLFKQAHAYVLEAAVDINRKVLEDITVDDAHMVDALAKEMSAHDYKH